MPVPSQGELHLPRLKAQRPRQRVAGSRARRSFLLLTANNDTALRTRCYERVLAHGSRLLFSTDTGENNAAHPTQQVRAGMLPAAGELAVMIVGELCSRQEPTGDDPHLQNLIAEVNNIRWARGRRISDAHRVQVGMNLVRHTRTCGYPEHPLVDVAQIAMKPGLIPAHHLIRRLNQHTREDLHQEAAAAAVHRVCRDEYTTHD